VEFPRVYLSPPDVGELESLKALEAIESGWVAPIGPHVDEFEAVVAGLASRRHCVALSSGTAALHLGLLALGVKPGQTVICSTMTFVATANSISYVGAKPVFVDSDKTGNISVDLLTVAIEEVLASGGEIGAIVVVDFLGSLANYEEIIPLCATYQIPVLSDAAESVGASRNGMPAGSSGVVAAFSFNGNKIVTTSGGGAFLTDDDGMARTARHLSTQAREKAKHYEHADLGYNYRLSNVLAAIGIAQFERLDEMVGRRREIRSKYRDLFSVVDGVEVLGLSDSEDNCWLTSIKVNELTAGFSATDLSNYLESRNIESRPLWKPMHLQPLYESCEAFLDGSAQDLFEGGLALPSGSGMSSHEWDHIHSSFDEFFSRGG